MTQAEAIALPACPECGEPVMKVPMTGLVSCLAQLKFKACLWHVRVRPWEVSVGREKLTRAEKVYQEQQERINKMREQYGSD